MPEGLWIKESFVNETEGYRFGDSDWYETSFDTLGSLFRDLQREYGGCVSKMYRETGDTPPTVVGWVFQRTMEYEDNRMCCPYGHELKLGKVHYCNADGRRYERKTYIREVWVEVSDIEPERIPTHYVGAHSPWAA